MGKYQVSRGATQKHSVPKRIGIRSVVKSLMEWSIALGFLKKAQDRAITLIPEPLAPEAWHIFRSEIEEPLEVKGIVEIHPIACAQAVSG